MNIKELQELNKPLIDELKYKFSGSADYLSGVNDGIYALLERFGEVVIDKNIVKEYCKHNAVAFVKWKNQNSLKQINYGK